MTVSSQAPRTVDTSTKKENDLSTRQNVNKAPNLVQQWLEEIDLEADTSAVQQAFSDAGIDSPAALAALEATHFAALHICTSSDRRKVFFLVQRIKRWLEEEKGKEGKLTKENKGESDHLLTNERRKTRQQSLQLLSTTTFSSSAKEPSRKLVKSASDLLDDVLNDDIISPKERNSVQSRSVTTRTSGLVPPKTNASNRMICSAKTVTTAGMSTSHRMEIPLRNGKGLSTIPSETVPPMSPLLDLPMQPCNDKKKHRRRSRSFDVRVKRQPARSDNDDSHSVSSNDGDHSKTRNLSTRRTSTAPYQRSNSEYSHRRQSLAVHTNNSRSKSSRLSVAGAEAPSAVTQSFQHQINELRQEAVAEWDLFGPVAAVSSNDDDLMRIRVVVRSRPLTATEHATHDIDILQPLDYGSYGRLFLYQPRTRVDCTKHIDRLSFCFDNVFASSATNAELYQRSIRNLIPSFLSGQWASIFAYGQTGSGKTFTMMGQKCTATGQGKPQHSEDVSNLGLYYMAALDIFHAVQSPGYEGYSIRVSFFEIYGGKLLDLLNGRTLVKCLEDSRGNVCFPGLSEHPVTSANELMGRMEEGAALRSTGTTSRNSDSSRSHAVLQLHLYRSTENDEYSRLTLIDLAGSERGADTSTASRATRLEGAEINTSLLALKEVIRALATGDAWTHVPFRGSKLTQVLKQSFVGRNCRSVMIACVSPNMGNCEPTLNTLRYADRVKERNPDTGAFAPPKVTTPVRNLSRSSSSAAHNTSSDVLDELLASPEDYEKSKFREKIPKSSTVLHELFATHKDATEVMVDMIQEEVVLVNTTDATRSSLDSYMAQLYRFQDEQLAMITLLREQLRHCRQLHPKDSDDTLDDSFEDLRD